MTGTDRPWVVEFEKRSLVIAFMAALDAFYAATLILPGNWTNVVVRNSVLFTLAGFVAVQIAIFLNCVKRGTLPGIILHVRKVHFLQAGFQLSFMFYWGLYWHPVFVNFYLIAIQVGFIYLFDSTLSWIQRGSFQLGFAQFPIICSINLFLWFFPDFFYAQLVLIAAAIAAKAFITWQRDGRRTHIFNPTALPLALAAILLLYLAPTEIAVGTDFPGSQELGPHVLEVLFLLTLVINIWFPTVLITSSIVITTIALDYLTTFLFGMPAYIVPISAPVFLGAVLLVTDPATSPITKCGRVLFGISYGVLVYLIPVLLFAMQLPFSAEKVLAVPIVNLLVPWFDLAGIRLSTWLVRPLGKATVVLQSRYFHIAVWIAFFVAAEGPLTAQTPALLKPPKWLHYSIELVNAQIDVRNLCRSRSDICQQFGLFKELSYRLGE